MVQVKQEYREQVFSHFRLKDKNIEELMGAITFREIASGSILLSEGEVATKLYFVVRGCLRMYFIKEDGKDITAQFFIEDQIVASFESATTGTPSRAYIEAIEDSIVGSIPFVVLEEILSKSIIMREEFSKFIMNRLAYYMERCSSYILDTPEKRYLNLLEESPELVARLPKQYIASFLGITPVSLSRIRSRLKKKNNRD